MLACRIHRFRTVVVVLATVFSLVTQAYAFGEVFRIETSGIEYCGDFDFAKFSASSAVPLWVRIDGETQLTVSLTPDFTPGTTFPMTGFYYLTRSNAASFIGGVLFDNGAYATIQGEARLDKNSGGVTQIGGVFVQNGVIFEGCFSSGRFKSAKS